ncbi:MAG: hypothetical protein KDA60_01420 [Planctomycetales bacterium]|nr:hypothetical protein [Planctomycetales bacterium]
MRRRDGSRKVDDDGQPRRSAPRHLLAMSALLVIALGVSSSSAQQVPLSNSWNESPISGSVQQTPKQTARIMLCDAREWARRGYFVGARQLVQQAAELPVQWLDGEVSPQVVWQEIQLAQQQRNTSSQPSDLGDPTSELQPIGRTTFEQPTTPVPRETTIANHANATSNPSIGIESVSPAAVTAPSLALDSSPPVETIQQHMVPPRGQSPPTDRGDASAMPRRKAMLSGRPRSATAQASLPAGTVSASTIQTPQGEPQPPRTPLASSPSPPPAQPGVTLPSSATVYLAPLPTSSAPEQVRGVRRENESMGLGPIIATSLLCLLLCPALMVLATVIVCRLFGRCFPLIRVEFVTTSSRLSHANCEGTSTSRHDQSAPQSSSDVSAQSQSFDPAEVHEQHELRSQSQEPAGKRTPLEPPLPTPLRQPALSVVSPDDECNDATTQDARGFDGNENDIWEAILASNMALRNSSTTIRRAA